MSLSFNWTFNAAVQSANIAYDLGMAGWRVKEIADILAEGKTEGVAGRAGEILLRMLGVAFSARELTKLRQADEIVSRTKRIG